jgi:hypothetical protein
VIVKPGLMQVLQFFIDPLQFVSHFHLIKELKFVIAD